MKNSMIYFISTIVVIIYLEVYCSYLEKKVEKKTTKEYQKNEILQIMMNNFEITDLKVKHGNDYSFSYLESVVIVKENEIGLIPTIKMVHEISHAIDSKTSFSKKIFLIIPHIRIAKWVIYIIAFVLYILRNNMINTKPLVNMFLVLGLFDILITLILEVRANRILISSSIIEIYKVTKKYLYITVTSQIIWKLYILVAFYLFIILLRTN